MPNRLQTLRLKAYQKQKGYCYYCNMPMWEICPNELVTRYQISIAQVRLLKSTAEHLVARQDGGKDNAENIVAACLFCNKHRHSTKKPKNPERFKDKVLFRMALGKWTASLIPNNVLS